jgi:hypothetical protein
MAVKEIQPKMDGSQTGSVASFRVEERAQEAPLSLFASE